MNLNMIRPKTGTEGLSVLKLNSVKHLSNKHIENQKKLSNSKYSNQENHFISIHQFKLKETGCWA